MRYHKLSIDGYIVLVGIGYGCTEISKTEYDAIYQKIQNKPQNSDGYQYKLRADDLEWEMVELPEPEPIEEDAEVSDYENALSDLGVRFGD